MKTAFLLLLLPGCAAIGLPAPWHTTEEVTEIADTVAAERVTALAVAVEADIAPLPSLEIPTPYKAPERPSGTDWGSLIAYAITALTGTAGAIGYRAFDHRSKRKKAAAA